MHIRSSPLFSIGLLAFLLFNGCHSMTDEEDEMLRLPAEALSTFELPEGFQIEQIAAEPLISDPVDMCIDEEGRMYVVEMHGYPLDLENTGKVILLEDEDGDGIMDKRTVFEEGLLFPSGIMRWKDGVLVTDAPYVYYLEDTDGDGIADIKDTLLTGFALTNPQYLVNTPRYGLDNWIYLAHERFSDTETYQDIFGDEGEDVFFLHQPDGPKLGINADGKIVRFSRDMKRIETTSSYTQFGLTFDRWGHHFNVENDNHIFQEVLAQKYVERNPELVVGSTMEALSDHGKAGEVFPITKNPEHQLLTDVGLFTSACGIISYDGGAFPEGFNEHLTLVCEPVSNIVHADVLTPNGATFVASKKFEDKEFLASTDLWFRPVNQYIGPDGALYVVDYYREIIEHPEWMSDEAIRSGRLYNGIDQGRIYRITKKGAGKAEWTKNLNLRQLSSEDLVQKLESPNIWWRLNAQRLLLDRQAEDIAPDLEELLHSSESATARLHALWTLEGLQQLSEKDIQTGLKDAHPGVRENALKLAELYLDAFPDLAVDLIRLKEDPDDRVKFQLLCTLGELNTPEANHARQELLFENIADPWMQIAALSAKEVASKDLLDEIFEKYEEKEPAYNQLIQRLASSIGTGKSVDQIRSLYIKGIRSGEPWQDALLSGLAEGIGHRTQTASRFATLREEVHSSILSHENTTVRRYDREILKKIGYGSKADKERLSNEASIIAFDKTEETEKRAEAIQLMADLDARKFKSDFENLLKKEASFPIQKAALQGLNEIEGTGVSEFILKHWDSFSTRLKDAALNTFINEEPYSIPRIRLLLKALQEEKIDKTALDWARAVILMRDTPDSLKTQFRKLLANQNGDRNAVIEEYKSVLTMEGDLKSGEAVYQVHCIVCHQFHGKMGIDFGPDLGTVKGWTAESILINILDPNKSIAHGYTMWSVAKKDGEIEQGILVSETSNALVLKNENGVEKTIPLKNIKSKTQLGISPMPADFEEKITKEEMADLIAFIKKGS